MKGVIISALILMLGLSAAPLISMNTQKDVKKVSASGLVKEILSTNETENFKVKTENGIIEVSAEEYVAGVLSKEVSPTIETEALKAQAVAAYTFALERKEKNKDKEYDITSSPETDQCFVPKSEISNLWGENAGTYYNKIISAVRAVKGEYLAYEKKPILAAYHSLCSGKTNTSKDVWGKELPYLVSVISTGDALSPALLSETEVSYSEAEQKLGQISDFTQIKTAKSGFVKTLKYGDKKYTGNEIRAAFSLKSANFTVTKKENSFVFTVKGNGHGVGMSQTGAQYMAQQGSSYKEILFHYYKNTEILSKNA